MKTSTPATAVIAAIFLICFSTSSCSKKDNSVTDLPKEQVVIGKWNINRIQLKIYVGGVFIKDTIIPQHPRPENFVKFDNDAAGFEYRFNSTTSNIGTYQFVGKDSIVSVAGAQTYRWKMLTLTNVLFTVKNTSTNDPGFPGAKVETYQTFVR